MKKQSVNQLTVRFWICDRRDHRPLSSHSSWKEAVAVMKEFVAEDKEADIFRPHFYEAVEYSIERGVVRVKISE